MQADLLIGGYVFAPGSESAPEGETARGQRIFPETQNHLWSPPTLSSVVGHVMMMVSARGWVFAGKVSPPFIQLAYKVPVSDSCDPQVQGNSLISSIQRDRKLKYSTF